MSDLPQARGRVVIRVARLCDRDSVDAVITAWDPHRFAHLPAELFPGDDPAALVGRRFLADVNLDATDTDGLDVTNLGPAPDVPGEWLPAAGVVERAAEVLYEDWRQGDGTAPNRRATLRPWAEIRSRKYWLRGPRALAAAGLLRTDAELAEDAEDVAAVEAARADGGPLIPHAEVMERYAADLTAIPTAHAVQVQVVGVSSDDPDFVEVDDGCGGRSMSLPAALLGHPKSLGGRYVLTAEVRRG